MVYYNFCCNYLVFDNSSAIAEKILRNADYRHNIMSNLVRE